MRRVFQAAALGVVLVSSPVVFAQSAADAKAMLKTIVGAVKAKGVAKAAEEVTAGTDASKCKETPGVNCLIASADAAMLGNAKNPRQAPSATIQVRQSDRT